MPIQDINFHETSLSQFLMVVIVFYFPKNHGISKNHQKFQVPKIEVLNLIAGDF